jgi:hypothetical protein
MTDRGDAAQIARLIVLQIAAVASSRQVGDSKGLIVTSLSSLVWPRDLVVLATRLAHRGGEARCEPAGAVRRAAFKHVGDDHRSRGRGSRSGGRAALLPGLRQAACAVGFARDRNVRMLNGVRSLRLRRACCQACETTHVLLPARSVPGRRDDAEVIGQALVAKAEGTGHRTIVARLGRPRGTVRGWLRAFARRGEAVGSYASAGWRTSSRLAAGKPTAGRLAAGDRRRGDLAPAQSMPASAECARRTVGAPVALTGLLHGRPRSLPGV